jgi:hypothetical protein
VDHEAVEVLVAPAEGELQGGMQIGDRTAAADEDPASDQGADAPQHHAELEDDGGTGCGHPVILHPSCSPGEPLSPTLRPALRMS